MRAFNNAGIIGPLGSVADLSFEQWQQVISINLNAVFLSLKHEIAEVAAFLLADAASFVVGADFYVDGGVSVNP